MLQVSTFDQPAEPDVTVIDSDSLLIKQVRQGQQEAFKRLYERHLPRVYGLCLRLTANRSLAEEAAQESFIQLWRKIDSFRGDSSFTTWLHSLTVNTTLSFLRKQKSWLSRISLGESYETEVEQLADNSSTDLTDLQVYLPRLPERARLVFVLHAIEGYRQEQVARSMGISVGAVKAHYHKASHQLKAWLTDAQEDATQ